MPGPWATLVRGWRWLLGRSAEPEPLGFDSDAEVAVHVAEHEAKRRGVPAFTTLDLLYGLLHTEAFTAAIQRLGGDPDAITDRIAAALERPQPADEVPRWRLQSESEAALRRHPHFIGRDAVLVLGRATASARYHRRIGTITDVWAALSRTDAGTALAAAGVDPDELLFLLVHGGPEPELARPLAHDVHVVVRNDDYTTTTLVTHILCKVFELPEAAATEAMLRAHDTGSTVVCRLAIADARRRIEVGRALARAQGAPLWIGVDDC